MTADLPDRATGDRERPCFCRPIVRAAHTHSRHCPQWISMEPTEAEIAATTAALAARPAPDDSGAAHREAERTGDARGFLARVEALQSDEELREAVVHALSGRRVRPDFAGAINIQEAAVIADALLSGPLAGLMAADTARAQAEEQVARVRAWAAMHDDMAREYEEAADSVTDSALVFGARERAEDCRAIAEGVRRALDGER